MRTPAFAVALVALASPTHADPQRIAPSRPPAGVVDAGPADAPLRAPAARIEDAAFLAGHWISDAGGAIAEEAWLPPRGGTLIGSGRVVAGGATAFFELLRIEERQGSLVLVAQPQGGPSVTFALVEKSDRALTFANPAHDQPKRITYRREGPALVAVVAGSDRDPAWSSTTRYRRATAGGR